MQMRLFFAELVMVSSAMAVLPVWRSPISSSRWPRPMGIMVSMALMPVAIGSRTDWRVVTAGGGRSAGGELLRVVGALLSVGRAGGVADRPLYGLPTWAHHVLA